MEINRSNIFEIVNKADLKPDKDYGQNFLVESDISKKIVNTLSIKEKESVLEVGPGLGSLTHFLAELDCLITVVDIDQRMTNFLRVVYQEKNVEIIENDIRKTDVSKYEKIIGNLPYNITTETIQYLLLNASRCQRMVFMIQSETLNHFYDVSGKEYGPTSVLIHLLGNIEKLFVVKAGSFYPVPKCNSTVFSINIDTRVDRFAAIKAFKVAKQLFLNRRKTILNNLVNYLNNKDLANELCEDLKINPLFRPEQLSPEMYLAISEYLSTK
ncbi:MAG: ribosomal RNA small subunit methyltransferase A [Bacilli bacterium]|nr:ribosomal RNA small subunit methyltransferase A [Bacilli bacterium]